MMRDKALLIAWIVLAGGCDESVADLPEDGRDEAFFVGGKGDGGLSASEVAAVLAVANAATLEELDDAAGLDRRAAEGIVAHRDGADGITGTADDDPFDDLAELDAVAWVGPSALAKLLAYADEIDPPTPAAACLIISEYVESKLAYNKALELYNCGDAALELDEYALCLVRNDDDDCTLTTALPATTLAPGDVFVACRSQRSHFNDPSPALVARCDEELGSAMLNSGDDRMVILHAPDGQDSVTTATVMDALGRIDFRPWWNPWRDVGLRRCTATPNPGNIFYETDDWFSTHPHSHYTDLGVAPTFACD